MRDAWDNVNQLLDQLRPFLKRAGVPESKYRMPNKEIDIDKYNEIFDFIHEVLMSDEWINVLEAWELCEPERWKFYDDYEIMGLQEQIIFENALKDLKKLWKPPKGFFNVKDTSSDDTKSSCSS